MAESTHEQIAQALKTRLETITTDSPKVLRCRDWPSAAVAERELTIYLKANPYTSTEGTSGDANGGFAEERASFSILIVKLYERSSNNAEDEEQRSEDLAPTVISRCIRDVVKALLSEVTLGGLAWNVADGQIEIDPDFRISGACLSAELTFSVKYHYKVSTA